LYGKNSLGGAINIITRKPDGSDSAEAVVTAGNYGEIDFTGRGNAALIDHVLFGSLSIATVDHKGYYQNTYRDGPDPSNADRQAFRAALRWRPDDSLTADLVSDYTHQHQTAATWRLESLVPGSLAAEALTVGGFNPAAYIVGQNPSPRELQNVALDSGAGTGSFLPPDTGARGRSGDDAGFTDESLVIADELSPGLTLRSITGYRGFSRFIAQDIDGTPASIADQVNSNDGHSLTTELQVNAQLFDNRLSLVAGAFALREGLYENQANDFLLGLADMTPALQGLSRRQVRRYENKSLATYSHAILNVTSAFKLTAGVRYSWERKEDAETDSSLASSVITGQFQARKSWGSTTPQFGAEYALNEHAFTYVTVSKGYASGGFSSAISGVGIQEYDPESLWNYEAGVKTQFFHDTLVFNASGFFMDYKNIVVQSFEAAANGTPQNVYANAGKAHVRGIDADVTWHPVRALQITSGLGLLQQEFLQYGIGQDGLPIPAASAHFFDSPSITPNATIQYVFPLTLSEGVLTAFAGWSYRSRTYFDNSNSITSSQAPYSVFNGHLSYGLPGGRFSMSIFGDNIGNQVYVVRTGNLLSSLGFALAQFGAPRTYGVRMKYEF
jgi:iron complex outermembrane recepter protein